MDGDHAYPERLREINAFSAVFKARLEEILRSEPDRRENGGYVAVAFAVKHDHHRRGGHTGGVHHLLELHGAGGRVEPVVEPAYLNGVEADRPNRRQSIGRIVSPGASEKDSDGSHIDPHNLPIRRRRGRPRAGLGAILLLIYPFNPSTSLEASRPDRPVRVEYWAE